MSRKPARSKQDEMIQEEIEKLNDLFVMLDDDKKQLAERVIERVAFMTITLQILENNIKTKGPVILFKQGKQQMYIENPAQKSYNTMINRYTAAYNSLFNLLPKDSVSDEDDEFDDF